MKKIPDEKVDKVKSDDNMEAIRRFLDPAGSYMYLFCLDNGGIPKYMTDPPAQEQIKKKMVLAIRARPPKNKDDPIEISL
jgi:hypothetical protein